MSASHSTYNRTLDEILGFSTAVSKSPDRPKPPPRRLSASRSSENSIGSVTAAKPTPVNSLQDRPSTRHGRSSQSESSSSSKAENNASETKHGIVSNLTVETWSREGNPNPSTIIPTRKGPKRTDLTRSVHTILENDQPSPVRLSSMSSSPESLHDEFMVEPKPAKFETSVEPFKLSPSLSSGSSSNLSAASQRTYSTKVNANNESPLNRSLIKIPSSPSSSPKSKQEIGEEPMVLKQRSTVHPSNKGVGEEPKSRLPPKVEVKPTSRTRGPTVPKKPLPRPRLSLQPRTELVEAQRAKLKSSMSTRQLLKDNSPSYNLWLQRTLENDKRKRAEEQAKREEEERKKAEQRTNAEKAFERWKSDYERKWSADRRRKRYEEEAERRQKQTELEEKRRNAEKTFEHWKKTQEEKRKAEKEELTRAERLRSQSVEVQKRKQREENDRAYHLWCDTLNQRMKKDRLIREAEKEEKKVKFDKDRSLKDSLAKEAYDLWLEMKHKEKLLANSLAYKILDYNVEAKKRWPVPWIPTTPTVPRKFVGTGNRRRTLDKPLNIVIGNSAKKTGKTSCGNIRTPFNIKQTVQKRAKSAY